MKITNTNRSSLETTYPFVRDLKYRPDIDGLRAIAVLSVIGFHGFPHLVPGGFCGVDIFFEISGYLISFIILKGLTDGTFSLWGFYARRIKRIFPALSVVLLATLIIGELVLLPDEFQYLGLHTALAGGFVLNWELYQALHWYFGAMTTPLIHLWSLGVEEQFYLLWPLLLAAFWKMPKACGWLTAVVVMLSFAYNIEIIDHDPLAAFYLPMSRLWELGTGGLLAYVEHQGGKAKAYEYHPSSTRRLFWRCVLNRDVSGAIGAVLIITSFFTLHGSHPYPGWRALAPVAGSLLLISAGPNSRINKHILSSKGMIWVGLLSYPLYLWHWPCLAFAHILWPYGAGSLLSFGAILVAVGAAYLTYRYVELPIRSYKRNIQVVACLCVAILICSSAGYLSFTQLIPSRSTSNIAGLLRSTSPELPPLHGRGWNTTESFLRIGRGTRGVLFVGDSNLYQYYSRIDQLMLENPSNSHSAIIAGRGGCPLMAIGMTDGPVAGCQAFMRRAVEYAMRPDIDTVVIGASWYLYLTTWQEDGQADTYGNPEPLLPSVDETLDELGKTIRRFVDNGKQVYIVLQTPIGTRFDPRRIIRRTILPPGFEMTESFRPTPEMRSVAEPIDRKLRSLAKSVHATVIDPIEFLCDSTRCPAISNNGELMYLDHNHLSPLYTRLHVRYLDSVLLDDKADRKERTKESQASNLN